MTDFSSLQTKVNDLKAKVAQNSISPMYMGALLDDFINVIRDVDASGVDSSSLLALNTDIANICAVLWPHVQFNLSPDALSVDNENMTLTIRESGFGIRLNDFNGLSSTSYFVANPVGSGDTSFRFTADHHRHYLCIDLHAAFKGDERTPINSACTITTIDAQNRHRYYPIALINYPPGAARIAERRVCLLAEFATLFRQDMSPDARRRMDFFPEFLSVRRGNSGTGWYDRISLMHISDVHEQWGLLAEALNLAQSTADCVINTGDVSSTVPNVDGAAALPRRLDTYSQIINAMRGRNAVLCSQGNHDCGLNRADFHTKMIEPMQAMGFVTGSPNRSYGYCDIAKAGMKLRVIMLDPYDSDVNDTYFSDGSGSWQLVRFSQSQIDWLITCMRDAASQGRGVITAMHYAFGDSDQWGASTVKPDCSFAQSAFMVPDIIDALQNGTELSRTYGSGSDTVSVKIAAGSGARLEFIAHLFGHIHSKNNYFCARADGSRVYDIMMLGEGALGVEGTAVNRVCHTPGEVNAAQLSLLQVDLKEKCIYRVAYGGFMHCNTDDSFRVTRLPFRLEAARRGNRIVDLGEMESVQAAHDAAAAREVVENPQVREIHWRAGGSGGSIVQSRHGLWYVAQAELFAGAERKCRVRMITTGGNYQVGAWQTLVVPTSVTYNASTRQVIAVDAAAGIGFPASQSRVLFTLPQASASAAGLMSPADKAKLDRAPSDTSAAIDEARRALFDEMWRSRGGTVDAAGDASKPYVANGVRLTRAEALAVWNASQALAGNVAGDALVGRWRYASVKTLLTINGVPGQKLSLLEAFHGCQAQVVAFGTTQGYTGVTAYAEISSMGNAFRDSLVRTVSGGIIISGCSGLNTAFAGCRYLESVSLRGLNSAVSFANSPALKLASLQYLVTNRANGSTAITVTVHADVYAKLTGDTTNAACAALTAAEREQWAALTAVATAGHISFARP